MNLMRHKNLYFLISAFFIVPGMISLILFGLKPAIDFTGGSLLELKVADREKYQNFDPLIWQEMADEEMIFQEVEKTGDDQLLFKGPEISNQEKESFTITLEAELGTLEELRFESLGPSIGRELLLKALYAVILVSFFITLYVWKQFDELKYGLSAVLAMFHDSLLLLGIFSLLGQFYAFEVDTLFVTAVLTTLSFSVHDTIVVYDRIRELKKKYHKVPLEDLANTAVVETLSRSLNNSLTIIIMLFALVLLGGASIQHFSIALLIGAVTGTYSSSFIAVPLLLLWPDKKK